MWTTYGNATDEINKDNDWEDEDAHEEEFAAATSTAFSHATPLAALDAALGLHLEIDEPASTSGAILNHNRI